MPDLFNVVFFYPDGTHTYERRNVTPEYAVQFALEATRRPAAKIGMLTKVMITDSLDLCCFLWEHDKGVVFPKKDRGKHEGVTGMDDRGVTSSGPGSTHTQTEN